MQEEQTDTQGAAAREREGGDYGTREGDEGHTKERRWCWQTVNSIEAQGEGSGKGEQTGPRYRERLVAMCLTSECPRSPSMLRCSR